MGQAARSVMPGNAAASFTESSVFTHNLFGIDLGLMRCMSGCLSEPFDGRAKGLEQAVSPLTLIGSRFYVSPVPYESYSNYREL